MPNLSAKIFEVFKFSKNLKSDAVPKPPQPTSENITVDDATEEDLGYKYDENYDSTNLPEDVTFDPEYDVKNKQEKPKKKKKSNHSKSENGKQTSANNVNTQATGHVVNIVNSSRVHWGHMFISNGGNGASKNSKHSDDSPEPTIKKCNLITLVMEAKIELEHEYIEYTSQNLGKNWHRLFRRLGFTQGKIETYQLDNANNGVAETRYKLLLDWKRNDQNSTVGRLATILWDEGEREVVKGLAIIYQKNKK